MLIAVSMMRDEADVAEHVVRHLWAEGVDHIIVADNNSTDGTGDICKQWHAEVIHDPEVGYYQDRKMSNLARLAYEQGATWVLPFDADEVFYAAEYPLDAFFRNLDADVDVVEAHGHDYIVTPDDPEHDNPFARIVHRRKDFQKLPKVAFRACPDPYVHMGNHDVDRRMGAPMERVGRLYYAHFQYRSLEQFKRKVRNGREAYEASDLHWNYGTHWRVAGAKSDAELAADWAAMCAEDGLICDPAPVLP